MSSGFLLDTNVLSEFSRRGEPNPQVQRWLRSVSPEALYVSVLTLAEIRRGIELLPAGKRREQLESWFKEELLGSLADVNILPVTREIGEGWAVWTARGQERGVQVAVMDGLIAATALAHGLTLVTRNTKDFEGLRVPMLNPWLDELK